MRKGNREWGMASEPLLFDELEGKAALARQTPLQHPRLHYVTMADESTVASSERGVLLIMAWWSTYAIVSFRRLMEVLQAPEAQDLDVVVADHDGALELYSHPELDAKLHGCGETAWIRAGRIVAVTWGRDGHLSYRECLERLTS